MKKTMKALDAEDFIDSEEIQDPSVDQGSDESGCTRRRKHAGKVQVPVQKVQKVENKAKSRTK